MTWTDERVAGEGEAAVEAVTRGHGMRGLLVETTVEDPSRSGELLLSTGQSCHKYHHLRLMLALHLSSRATVELKGNSSAGKLCATATASRHSVRCDVPGSDRMDRLSIVLTKFPALLPVTGFQIFRSMRSCLVEKWFGFGM